MKPSLSAGFSNLGHGLQYLKGPEERIWSPAIFNLDHPLSTDFHNLQHPQECAICRGRYSHETPSHVLTSVITCAFLLHNPLHSFFAASLLCHTPVPHLWLSSLSYLTHTQTTPLCQNSVPSMPNIPVLFLVLPSRSRPRFASQTLLLYYVTDFLITLFVFYINL